VREMEQMKVEMKHSNELYCSMNENLQTLSRNYGILAKSLDHIDVKEKLTIENRNNRHDLIKRLSTVITIMAGLIGMVYLILDHLPL